MWPFFVIVFSPFCTHLAYFFQAVENIGIQKFPPHASILPFYRCILRGLAWLYKQQFDISVFTRSRTGILVQFFRLRKYLILNRIKILIFILFFKCYSNAQNMYSCFIPKRFAERLPGVKLGKSFSG